MKAGTSLSQQLGFNVTGNRTNDWTAEYVVRFVKLKTSKPEIRERLLESRLRQTTNARFAFKFPKKEA